MPPALLKTASTGWRVTRYYRRDPAYRQAGPPPLLLRLLGPAVVASTLGLLGSGLVLVAIGPGTARSTSLALLGQRIDAVTVHQALFIAWAVLTGLHVLARIVPAARLTVARPAGSGVVAGGGRRATAAVAVLAVAVGSAAIVLAAAAPWRSDHGGHDDGRRPPAAVAPAR